MVVELGNPGPKYQNNRHNIGFRTVELYAERYGINLSRLQMKAQTGDGWITKTVEQKVKPKPQKAPLTEAGEADPVDASDAEQPPTPEIVTIRQKVLLAKPLTYMNNSGEAVADLARYYKVDPKDLLVIHDDLDLPPGKIRLRPGRWVWWAEWHSLDQPSVWEQAIMADCALELDVPPKEYHPPTMSCRTFCVPKQRFSPH